MGIILGLCWGYIGIVEKKMETTLEGFGNPNHPKSKV